LEVPQKERKKKREKEKKKERERKKDFKKTNPPKTMARAYDIILYIVL
jgi:hypothetical protein